MNARYFLLGSFVIMFAACDRPPEVVVIERTVVVTQVVTATPTPSPSIAVAPMINIECQGEAAIFTGGMTDAFDSSNGPELAQQSETLIQFLGEQSGYTKPLRHFDVTNVGQVFAHRFENLSPNRAKICGALLEIQVLPDSRDNPANDSLGLAFAVNPTLNPFAWRRHLGNNAGDGVPGLMDSPWAPGDSAVSLLLDLNNLSLAEGGTTSLIELLNEYNFLDIVINDDTTVDYIILTVSYEP